MLITRRHGSWVVLGTLVTDVELEPTPPLDAGCGECRLCIDACPTGALDEPGTLDATKCLSYWTQAPAADSRRSTAPQLGAQVYGCDICQDVCPWNRGVAQAPRRAARRMRGARRPRRRGSRRTATRWSTATTRLYVPRNEPRWLRRNALVALGNVGGPEHEPACSSGSRPATTRSSASTPSGRSTGSGRAHETAAAARVVDLASSASVAVPFALLQVVADRGDPRRATGRSRGPRPRCSPSAVCLAVRAQPPSTMRVRLTPLAMAFDFLIVSSFVLLFAFEPGHPDARAAADRDPGAVPCATACAGAS